MYRMIVRYILAMFVKWKGMEACGFVTEAAIPSCGCHT